MKISKLGLGLAVTLVVFASAAAILGSRYAARYSMSFAPKAVTAAARVRVTGSQPRVPQASLRLTGDVIELAPGAPLQVTATVGGQTYPAIVNGNTYTVNIGRPSPGQMVTVEARSTRVHYRTVVGSAGRARTQAGGDAHLTLSEQPSLRVSPYSTALQWLVRYALGDRDAGTDAEFESTMRVAASDDLAYAAYAMAVVARGEQNPAYGPNPYVDGYQLLRDRVAFAQFISYGNFRHDSAGYLFDQSPHIPLAGLAELPSQLAFVSGMPRDQLPMAAGDVFLLGSRDDGKFDFNERVPLRDAVHAIALDEQGRVQLAPEGDQVRSVQKPNAYGQIQFFDRKPAGRTLRRLTRGNETSVWVLRSNWLDTEQGNPQSPVTEVVEYRVLSSTGLDTWVQPDGWSTAADSTIALPWMCTSMASPEEHVYDLSRCEYVEHRFHPGGSGSTLDHGWKVDPHTMLPKPPRSQPFNWLPGAQGALDLTDGNVATTFWRLKYYPADIGPVFYRSKALTGTWSGKTMVGIDMAARKSMASWPVAATMGNWRNDEPNYLPNWYTTPNYETVTQRLAGGTGQSSVAGNSPVPFWWQAPGNAVYDKRTRVFYPPPRGERPPVVENCESAVSNGADVCYTYVYYFKPMARIGNRYYGIGDTYTRDFYPADPEQGLPEESSNFRTRSTLVYYDCTSGACLTAAMPTGHAPRIGPSADTRSPGSARIATPPRVQRLPIRHN